MQVRSALFFVYVWPEARSSAAGVRTLALMRSLQEAGWSVGAASPSKESPFRAELEAAGVNTFSCDPNASVETETSLSRLSPRLVIFDRFVMEEQFGWRARSLWPQALQLVDTQDLHCVRRAREALVGQPWERVLNPTLADLGENLLRELASLYRADGALVVSRWEEEMLLTRLFYPRSRLLCLPFPGSLDANPTPFSERRGFACLGNFRHPPNLDSVRWLIRTLWPAVRALLPEAELHLYGAYPPAEISRHKGEQGIFAHGPVSDHRAALRKHKALLAPLRFGAGIKGKVLEAWGTGTPVLGSPLTFEGMGENGLVAETTETFAAASLALVENEAIWQREQEKGLAAISRDFDATQLAQRFLSFVDLRLEGLPQGREQNLIGRMLCHHQANSTKYFSRWIEAKNRATSLSMSQARRLEILGRVQGVSYRESMREEALRLGATGWVRNRSDGSVEAWIQGEEAQVKALLSWAQRGPAAAHVKEVKVENVAFDPTIAAFSRRETI